jgi:hypothetical protein
VRPPPADVLDAIADVAHRLARTTEVEAGLELISEAALEVLGDAAAGERKDALRPGQRDWRVAGCFVITPDRRYNMLVGNRNFPPEQRRLMIPIAWNHPGVVVETRRPLLVADTDSDDRFRQFLKTSRMGSSIYAPVMVGDRMVGQCVAAAQARWTYEESDLDGLCALAGLAALHWRRTGADDWLTADYPAPDAWRAEEHAV